MMYSALPFRDEVKVARECLCILHQRVVWPRDGRIVDAIAVAVQLLAGLHPHLHRGHHDVVLGQLHVRLADDEPLAALPALVQTLCHGNVKAAGHANNRLFILAHGELLQVVVCLEHNLASTGARKPRRLEALDLHGVLGVGHVHGVQGEEGLPLVAAPDLQGGGEVLQVDGRRGLHGRGDAHGVVLLQHQAAHAPRQPGLQPGRHLYAPGDVLDLPANVILLTAVLLLAGLLLHESLLLLLQLPQHQLGQALSVCVCRLAVLGLVAHLPNGQLTVAAQLQRRVRREVLARALRGGCEVQVLLQALADLLVALQQALHLLLPAEGLALPSQLAPILPLRLTKALAVELHHQRLRVLLHGVLSGLCKHFLPLERDAYPAACRAVA
mmetsp:Transcript_105608/g.256491  ORF Transcript_105608/g.256491 Transcript_105608/m.256491 type:complete len:384 (-) Transcript_105608:234-1385(-)